MARTVSIRLMTRTFGERVIQIRPHWAARPLILDRELIDRARAALAAEPVGEGPTGDAAVEAAAELIYNQAMKWAATQPIPSDHINIPAWQQGGNSDAQEVARRTARAALAAKPLVKGPTNEEIERRFQVWWYDEGSGMPPGADEDPEAHVHRISQIAWHNGAYVARYGHQPAPPVEGEVAELAVFLRGCADDHHGHGRRQFTRAADLLERLASPACVVLKPSPELIEAFQDALPGRIEPLLEQRHPAPVPVAERLPGPEDCDAEGRCWLLTVEDEYPQWRLHSIEGNQPGGSTMIWVPVDSSPGVMVDAFYASHWLPATALPLPQGEVE